MNIKTRTCFENEFINIAKQKGYKARSGTIYKKKGDYFVSLHAGCSEIKFTYFSMIKRYQSDDIFWDIMNMSSNKKVSDSLKAVGAFSAPSITVFSESIDEKQLSIDIFHKIIDKFEILTTNYIDNNEFIKIIEGSNALNNNKYEVIKVLYYIEIKKYNFASAIINKQIKIDNGGFENNGKTFYELARNYLLSILV